MLVTFQSYKSHYYQAKILKVYLKQENQEKQNKENKNRTKQNSKDVSVTFFQNMPK